ATHHRSQQVAQEYLDAQLQHATPIDPFLCCFESARGRTTSRRTTTRVHARLQQTVLRPEPGRRCSLRAPPTRSALTATRRREIRLPSFARLADIVPAAWPVCGRWSSNHPGRPIHRLPPNR